MDSLNLEPCPFCGVTPPKFSDSITSYSGLINKYHISHTCPHGEELLSLCVIAWGKTLEEAVEQWNRKSIKIRQGGLEGMSDYKKTEREIAEYEKYHQRRTT